MIFLAGPPHVRKPWAMIDRKIKFIIKTPSAPPHSPYPIKLRVYLARLKSQLPYGNFTGRHRTWMNMAHRNS